MIKKSTLYGLAVVVMEKIWIRSWLGRGKAILLFYIAASHIINSNLIIGHLIGPIKPILI